MTVLLILARAGRRGHCRDLGPHVLAFADDADDDILAWIKTFRVLSQAQYNHELLQWREHRSFLAIDSTYAFLLLHRVTPPHVIQPLDMTRPAFTESFTLQFAAYEHKYIFDFYNQSVVFPYGAHIEDWLSHLGLIDKVYERVLDILRDMDMTMIRESLEQGRAKVAKYMDMDNSSVERGV